MCNSILSNLIDNLEMELEMIIKWLKDSGLVVNSGKTEICLFHINDQLGINVKFPVKKSKVKNQLMFLVLLSTAS